MENKTLALSNLDLRVIEMLEELQGWAEAFEREGDPLDGNMPNIPALRSLAEVYPETPDPKVGADENGVYHCDTYITMLFECMDSESDGLANGCEMWIHQLKAQP